MLGRRQLLELFAFALAGSGCTHERGSEAIRVAAASNVADVVALIAAAYRERGGAEIAISSGSSGKLYAQIENGAPFHVFLSADAQRPALLEAKGLALPGSRFTYALGRLALIGRKLEHPADGAVDLRAGRFERLAIANPATAPYGVAALEVLDRLGVRVADDKLVRGENVAQALQFVDSGAVDLGLVAFSNVKARGERSFWKVPGNLHAPIRQDAVQLTASRSQAEAGRFFAFLRGESARALFSRAGYDVPAHD